MIADPLIAGAHRWMRPGGKLIWRSATAA